MSEHWPHLTLLIRGRDKRHRVESGGKMLSCEGHRAGVAESIQELQRVRMRSDQAGSVEIEINLRPK